MKGICQICKIMPADETHHIKWVADGGTNEKQNLIDVCHECHRYAPNDPSLLEKYLANSGVYGEMMKFALSYGYNASKENIPEKQCIDNFYNDVFIKIAGDTQDAFKNIGFYFLRDRAKMVKKKMHDKALNAGGLLGSPHPYGYQNIHGKMILKPEEANVVREIYRQYLDGKSTIRIAAILTEKNIPTKRGGRWDGVTISYILKNSIYAGFIEWEDTLHKGSHDAIVDPKDFNLVQERLVHMIRRPEQRYKPRLLPIESLDSSSETRKGGEKGQNRLF
jgi:hypothetical protein